MSQSETSKLLPKRTDTIIIIIDDESPENSMSYSQLAVTAGQWTAAWSKALIKNVGICTATGATLAFLVGYAGARGSEPCIDKNNSIAVDQSVCCAITVCC